MSIDRDTPPVFGAFTQPNAEEIRKQTRQQAIEGMAYAGTTNVDPYALFNKIRGAAREALTNAGALSIESNKSIAGETRKAFADDEQAEDRRLIALSIIFPINVALETIKQANLLINCGLEGDLSPTNTDEVSSYYQTEQGFRFDVICYSSIKADMALSQHAEFLQSHGQRVFIGQMDKTASWDWAVRESAETLTNTILESNNIEEYEIHPANLKTVKKIIARQNNEKRSIVGGSLHAEVTPPR